MAELQLGGRRIAYRDTGEGPAVILLHSSSSHSGQFRDLTIALSGEFRVLAPDLHGYGRSDPLPDDGAPWWQHDVEIVHALLDIAGPAHLVGHSLGGAAAFCAAKGEPRVKSLTVFEPVLFMLLAEARDPSIDEAQVIAANVSDRLIHGDAVGAAQAFTDFWSGEGAYESLPEPTREYVTDTVGRVHTDFEGVLKRFDGGPVLADAEALVMPALCLRGGESREGARAIVALLARTIPSAEFKTFPGVGHMGPVTHPDEINPVIVDFIRRVEIGAEPEVAT